MYPQSDYPAVGFIEALLAVLTRPRAETVWKLRGIMMDHGLQPNEPLWRILADFHEYLNALTASGTARRYSEFAAQLDMAAIGGVALQNLVHEREQEGWFSRLLLAVASEGLMVTAARQYIKAWNEEMQATYRAAAWSLFDEFWALSQTLQPRLQSVKRRTMIERLVAPLRDEAGEGLFKAGFGVRLYQVLLLAGLEQGGWLGEAGGSSGPDQADG